MSTYEQIGYILRRNSENREISSLYKEQHDIIQHICSVRHKYHSYTTINIREYYEWIVETNTQLEELDLPLIENFVSYDDLDFYEECLQEYWDSCTSDDEKEQYNNDYDKWSDNVINDKNEIITEYTDEKLKENYNSAIEDLLKKIDNIHGTNYCPSGVARLRYYNNSIF